jgi:hypothetical protein
MSTIVPAADGRVGKMAGHQFRYKARRCQTRQHIQRANRDTFDRTNQLAAVMVFGIAEIPIVGRGQGNAPTAHRLR